MAAEIIFPLIAAGFILYEVLTRKKRDLAAVQEYGREHNWELLIIHPGSPPALLHTTTTGTNYYVTRYRTADGATHEAYLQIGWFSGVTLVEANRLPAKLARAMENPHFPMDCRDCGTRMAAGAMQCPYCKAWRGTFKEG